MFEPLLTHLQNGHDIDHICLLGHYEGLNTMNA